MTETIERPTAISEDVWARLTAPFPPDQIEKLPKQLRKGDDDRGQCRQGTKYSADNYFCGGYHARAIHLDYVGHAGITTRLNEVAGPPNWSWEPMYRDVSPEMADLIKAALAAGDHALARVLFESCPARYTDGGLWIRLTILGASKPGFGDAQGKHGTDATKEIIGDGIRNAALRFGIATYLWSKSPAAQILKAGGDPSVLDGPESPQQVPAQNGRRKPNLAAKVGPDVALKTARQAAAEVDVSVLERVRAWAAEKGLDGADIRSAIGPEVEAFRLPDGPITLGSWLAECIQRVGEEGISIEDQVRMITSEPVESVADGSGPEVAA